jgi:hypothetical protein
MKVIVKIIAKRKVKQEGKQDEILFDVELNREDLRYNNEKELIGFSESGQDKVDELIPTVIIFHGHGSASEFEYTMEVSD